MRSRALHAVGFRSRPSPPSQNPNGLRWRWLPPRNQKGITTRTGPKISSRWIFISTATFGEDRRPDEEPLAIIDRPIHVQHVHRRAPVNAQGGVTLHPIELAARDQRADHRAHVERIAYADGDSEFAHSIEDAALNRPRDKQAGSGRAGLSLIGQETEQGGSRGIVDVGVLEHDARRFSAKFQRDRI